MSSETINILITSPFTEHQVEEIRSISPRLKVTAMRAHHPDEIPADLWAKTDILYTDSVLPDEKLVPKLKWIQFHYAGIDYLLDKPLLQMEGLEVTTLSGANSPQMAEYALTLMLALSANLKGMIDNQSKLIWPEKRWEIFRQYDLRESTVGLVGYGSVGREIARLLLPFGVTLLAAKRDLRELEDDGFIFEGQGDPFGDLFTRLYPIEALKSMVKECDYVIVVLPLTPETRNLIGAEEFASMKPSLLFIDLSRGGIVDQTALVEALEKKTIAGAALDVFEKEPLDAKNSLWKMPNVIISPHIAGVSTHYNERAVKLFQTNLSRFLEKKPLFNRFDFEKGY